MHKATTGAITSRIYMDEPTYASQGLAICTWMHLRMHRMASQYALNMHMDAPKNASQAHECTYESMGINQIGINRRSKQVVYADDGRMVDRPWTPIYRALSSSQACTQKAQTQTCKVVGLPERAPTSRLAWDDPPGNRGSSACTY